MIHYENMTKDRIISLLKDTLEYAEEKDKEIERLNNALKEYDRGTYCKLINENRKLNNIINELEKELDRGYLDLFEHELVPGRELITNIKNYIQELKGSDKN